MCLATVELHESIYYLLAPIFQGEFRIFFTNKGDVSRIIAFNMLKNITFGGPTHF